MVRFALLVGFLMTTAKPGHVGTHFRLPSSYTEALPKSVATCLVASLRSSGTAARLGKAGLSFVGADVAIPAERMGAAAAFRTRTVGVTADVYFFENSAAQRRALHSEKNGPFARWTRNGAFLVRVSTASPEYVHAMSEVLSTIAGEE